jgi:hypothetical protein
LISKEKIMSTFEPARCPKCGQVHEGQHIGTIMVKGVISIYHKSKANEPIAGYVYCPRCHHLHDMWLINGADKLGITIHDVRNCWKQMRCDFYALSELKAQKVRGVNPQPVVVDYNADKFIEPKETKEELF